MLYKKFVSLEDRINLPLNGPGNYQIKDNIIYTRAIEINAVRQCNLSCKSCSHSAPLASDRIYDFENLQSDLKEASKYIKCETIRIVGGEPLLHSHFDKIINSIKKSKISENICLVTNGILLYKLDDNTLKNIDKIEISLYPLPKKSRDKIISLAQKIAQNGTKVTILEYSSFRESISQLPTNDNEKIKLIYETCQIAHFFRCITIDNGRIYRCPQSMIFAEQLNDYNDSLEIYNSEDMSNLLTFLENNNPIKACSKCLGSIGLSFEHKQISKEKWVESLPLIPEDSIDYEYANDLLNDAHFETKCMVRKKIK